MEARVVGVLQTLQGNGAQTLILRIDRQDVEVTVSLPQLEQIVESFQHAAIYRAYQQGNDLPFVRLTMTGAHVAHKSEMSELMVSTLELGSVVLVAESATNVLPMAKPPLRDEDSGGSS